MNQVLQIELTSLLSKVEGVNYCLVKIERMSDDNDDLILNLSTINYSSRGLKMKQNLYVQLETRFIQWVESKIFLMEANLKLKDICQIDDFFYDSLKLTWEIGEFNYTKEGIK